MCDCGGEDDDDRSNGDGGGTTMTMVVLLTSNETLNNFNKTPFQCKHPLDIIKHTHQTRCMFKINITYIDINRPRTLTKSNAIRIEPTTNPNIFNKRISSRNQKPEHIQ